MYSRDDLGKPSRSGDGKGPVQEWEVALMLSEFLFYLLGIVAVLGPFSS